MTQKQLKKIKKLKENNKELKNLLLKLRRDLGYLIKKVQSSTDKVLINSRIDSIRKIKIGSSK